MVTRYTLARNGRPVVAGTLALVVPQALAAARQGHTVTVSDPDGRTASIRATPPAVELAPPTELFPNYDTETLPHWLDRAAELLTHL